MSLVRGTDRSDLVCTEGKLGCGMMMMNLLPLVLGFCSPRREGGMGMSIRGCVVRE